MDAELFTMYAGEKLFAGPNTVNAQLHMSGGTETETDPVHVSRRLVGYPNTG